MASLVFALALGLCVPAPCLAQATEPVPVQVSLTDPNIQYIGRWDRSDPALYHGYWGGVYLRARFTGTSVGIKLANRTGLVASIDNEAFRTVDGGGADTVLLNARPLKPGTHSLLVGSAGQNYEVSFQALVLDAGSATVAPESTRPLIEFIGDSITTGTGSPAGTLNWAWNTAEALGCDHTQIAFSGRALTTGFGCAKDKAALDTQYLCLKNFNHLADNPQPQWSFSYTPDVIVINLGQNDQCGSEPHAVLQASYVKFLRMLWEHFPKAEIVAMEPFSHAYADEIKTAVHEIAAAGNPHVHYADTSDWLQREDYVDGVHPNGVGNLKVMGRLTPLLRPLVPAK